MYTAKLIGILGFKGYFWHWEIRIDGIIVGYTATRADRTEKHAIRTFIKDPVLTQYLS